MTFVKKHRVTVNLGRNIPSFTSKSRELLTGWQQTMLPSELVHILIVLTY